MKTVKPLKILTVPEHEEMLRTKSKDVTIKEITGEKFQNTLKQLHATIKDSPEQTGWEAAGLSAIQVGLPISVFLAMDVNTREFVEYINPQMRTLGTSQELGIEACLSIPELTGKVRRHKRVRITYYDKSGNKQKKDFSGYNARIIQHEMDHLNGTLFTDRLQ